MHLVVIAALCCLSLVHSDYILTTPRRWPKGGKVQHPRRAPVQVCASLFNNQVFDNEVDNWHVTVLNADNRKQFLPKTQLSLPQGLTMACRDVRTPELDTRKATIKLEGQLGRKSFDEEVNVTVVDQIFTTFIQPDKALYKPGQKVQFRILTIDSTAGTVWTEPYEEIFVNTPKRVRIAQWKNVTNNGLVHLSMDLHKEADKGYYTVTVIPGKDKRKFSTSFEVNEFVLPRYEVTVKSPHYITGNDTKFDLEMCARYTFGQPVKGKAFLNVYVGNFRKTYANLTQNADINGCVNFTFPTKELRFDDNNCHIRISSVSAQGKVIEAGTGTELPADEQKFYVNRKIVSFSDVTELSGAKKAFLPVVKSISATYPDRSPAANEVVEICTFASFGSRICRNFTTDANGLVSILLPSEHRDSLEVRAVKYPRIERNFNDVMEESKAFISRRSYNSISEVNNASISIYQADKLQCEPGKPIKVNLPLIFVAKGQTTAQVKVQTLSKLYVVDLHNETIKLENTPLPFDNADILLPLKKLEPGFVRGMVNISFTVPDNISPKANIIVYFKTDNGAVVADEATLDVTPCLSHNVNFKWSVEKAEPGNTVSYTVEGEPNSICSIGAIDKSVELLKSRDRLTIQTILNSYEQIYGRRWDEKQLDFDYCLKKYNNTKAAQEISKAQTENPKYIAELRNNYIREDSYEAIQIFNNAGYHVFSNLNLEKQYCDEQFHQALKKITASEVPVPSGNGFGGFSGGAVEVQFKKPAAQAQVAAAPAADFAPNDVSADFDSVSADAKTGTIAEEAPRERVFFPETWLWDIVTTDETGKFTQELQVPDTITEWIGNAVCITGGDFNEVGISNDSSIITFTPFFTDLTLPAAVKRGEILPVVISTFSYADSPLPVTLRVLPSPDYELVKDNEIAKDGTIQDCILPNENKVHRIKILPKIIGQMNITVEATTNSQDTACNANPPVKSDRLIKPILVKAEGFLRETFWNNYICAQDVNNEPITWNIDVPANIVNASDRAWINVIGDLVGPAIDNIESLVRMPYGCGEQNLITFTPNVFIMDYLAETNKLTDEIRNKLTGHLNSGYQRQLRFVRRDGSSSTFGDKDEIGSSWLTAFVLKSFSHADKYITIDKEVLKKSVRYLKNNVNLETGCFDATGTVVNKMLQSKHEGRNSLLNAYIVAALVESNFNKTERNAIAKAVQCFSSDTSTHPYSLALRAYALVLAGAPEAQSVLDQLVAAAIDTNSELRWPLPDAHKNKALEVETAAYALLAMLSSDPVKYTQETRKIVRWLNTNRNGGGGFVSTQDTVVALQALALFSRLLPNDGAVDMTVNVNAPAVKENLSINEQNKFLQQRIDLERDSRPISFDISGSGCSLLQGVLRYNVLGESTDEFFSVKATASPAANCNQNITLCTRYLLNDEATNMANIVVDMVTGYKPIIADLNRITSKPPFKRYEIENGDITFYLDEITNTEICASFTVEQEIEVGNAQPGTVRVYDYYQPEISSEKTYKIAQCSKGETQP